MPYNVYSCGSNGRYQLGTGSDDDLDRLELVWRSDIPIKKIACGGNHTLILLTNGDLYSSGDNRFGQCGFESRESITHFEKVRGGPWKDCSAGYEYSTLVAEDDTIFSAGFGPKGELGLGGKQTKSSTLQRISWQPPSTVTEIKSCLDHNIVSLKSGELYGWGNGRSGKLGEPSESKIWEPRKIQLNVPATRFDLGRDFTVAGDDEKIFLLGKDRYGVLEKIPQKTKDFKAMWSSVHIIEEGDSIVSLGNNSHGQVIPQSSASYKMFDVGSEHGVIVQDKNRVVCWGWGEHGNCGIKKDDSVTFDYFNELHDFGDETVVLIKGGCATTWVVTQT